MRHFTNALAIILYSAMCLACAVFPAAAQTLWQGTAYGMPLEGVKALFPAAVSPGEPASSQDGTQEGLRVRKATFLGRPFSVSFLFRENRLVRVNLSLQPPISKRDAAELFDSVSGALWAKYGKPINLTRQKAASRRDVPQDHIAARWNVGATDIDLLGSRIGHMQPILTISYQVVDEGVFSSPTVVATSTSYVVIADGCKGGNEFCEDAFFRFARKGDCKELRPGGWAVIHYCGTSNIPCEHMGYSFQLDGLTYRVSRSHQVVATGPKGEKVSSEQGALLTAPPRPSFQRTAKGCAVVGR